MTTQAFIAECTGKAVFETRAQAIRSMDTMRKKSRRAFKRLGRGLYLLPYQCRHCRHWHLGSG